MSTETITAEYMAWLKANPNVPELSADEALLELITPEPAERSPKLIAQIDWLVDFIDRWENAKEHQVGLWPRMRGEVVMRLWIIFATDPNGDSLDWFVRAPNEERALAIWREIEMVKDMWPDGNPSIWPVPPLEGPEGMVEWNSVT